tara:strand:- start:314 stop:589 length:276 start_codon:yes stop_codon:yes gene_type:complete
MSSKAYEGEWENGYRFSHGTARFAGQTRDKLQDNGIILRTTYGILPVDNSVAFTGGMVATISERIKADIVEPKKENYIDKMLDRAAWENGY